MFKTTEKKYQEAKKASQSLLLNDTFTETSSLDIKKTVNFTDADKLVPFSVEDTKPRVSLFGFFGRAAGKTDAKLKESLMDNQISVR